MRIPETHIRKPAPYKHVLNLINALLAISVLVLAVITLFVFFKPIQLESQEPSADMIKSILSTSLSELLPAASNDDANLSRVIREGLFKTATPLRNKPMADKTIEKIKSKLKLQCIMQMNQESVAYINISGVGLKQCRLGQSISNLFTVLAIYNDNVEISIVDHKVILRM